MAKKIIFLISILLLTACSLPGNKKQADTNNMSTTKNKILMVVAPLDFRDQEYFDPKAVFEKSGVEVKTASIQKGSAKGADGGSTEIDLTVSDVNVDDFDAVAFIGGPGMAQIVEDESLQVLAKKFNDAGKLTTAICVAPAILAKIGLLQGKNATSWSGVKEDLSLGGAIFINEPVVRDGNIITAEGPSAAEKFGEKIVEALSEE